MPFLGKPELLPSKTPTEIDIAWAAGVYEGEGCCPQRQPGSRKWNAALASIVQKDPEILHKLRDLFGGRVRFAKCSTVAPEKQVFVLEISGDNARLFLARIFQYLSTRRKAQIQRTTTFSFLNGELPDRMTIEDIITKLDAFNLTRYKMGTTPEEQRVYKNKQRNAYRANKNGKSSLIERVN